jgi:F-type H+-transporting ATPase subunit delta
VNIQLERIAKRYAQAFLNLYVKKMDRESMENTLILADFLDKHRSVFYYLYVASKDADITNELLRLFEDAQLPKEFTALIDLLIEDKRVFLFSRVLRQIHDLYLRRMNVVQFTIESAVTLTEDERGQVKVFLEHQTRKEIRATYKVDPSLIAGLRVYSDTLGFEYSIRKELAKLRSPLH